MIISYFNSLMGIYLELSQFGLVEDKQNITNGASICFSPFMLFGTVSNDFFSFISYSELLLF